MSIYIHIPFCKTICTYCDFCKFYYNEKLAWEYLKALEKEIKKNYKNELVKTIYIGGGTPSCLKLEQLKYLLELLNIFNKADDLEVTIEINPDCDVEIIKLISQYVNRVSIGVQSVNEKKLKVLGRNHTKKQIIDTLNNLKKYGISNINVDLIYAVKNETLKDLDEEIDFILSLNVPHISTYSLIIEEHTLLYINKIESISEDLDYEMYKLILNKLKQYNHYEISNFSLDGYMSKHNLTYWNNEEYYGFGLSSSGYIKNIRYTNTSNINKYLKGEYIKEKKLLSKRETIENEFILGFRKIDGIAIDKFEKKYKMSIYIEPVKKLLKEKKLIVKNNKLKINDKYIYTSNSILVDFIGLEDL